MSLKIFVLILAFTQISSALQFDGSCPSDVPETLDFNCLEKRYNLPDRFRVVAHLPVDSQTLNIFYTPFNLTCLSLAIGCEYLSVSQIYIQQHCFDSDIHYSVYCDPVSVDLGAKNDSPSIIRFGKGLESMCAAQVGEYRLVVRFSVMSGYWVLYGCREITESGQTFHDEGAWILVSKTSIKDFSPEVLTKAFDEDLKGITAKRSDFIMTNLTALDEGCDFEWKYCKYYQVCTQKEYPQYFYYYDEGLNYNYPEYGKNEELSTVNSLMTRSTESNQKSSDYQEGINVLQTQAESVLEDETDFQSYQANSLNITE